jgi:hypothetical protein
MDEDRYEILVEHGTDILPLRCFGNLLMKLGTRMTLLGMEWGTITTIIDNEEDWDD